MSYSLTNSNKFCTYSVNNLENKTLPPMVATLSGDWGIYIRVHIEEVVRWQEFLRLDPHDTRVVLRWCGATSPSLAGHLMPIPLGSLASPITVGRTRYAMRLQIGI